MVRVLTKCITNCTKIQTLNTKSYILFGFKILSLVDNSGNSLFVNDVPNSPFGLRPVLLLCQKENKDNIKFIMEEVINPEVSVINQDGLVLHDGKVTVNITRSMFDGKMSSILSGAGGASCQLCTATFSELKDLDLIRAGYPINRTISAARSIFDSVDTEDFLSLPSKQRFGLTHEPLSNIDIMPASPLHTYTCVFRWFMLVVYHLHSGTCEWYPTSPTIQSSMRFVRSLIQEKTGMKVDQPSSEGGTSSTGNIARSCFMNKNDFLTWVSTVIPSEFRDTLKIIHCNISAILRVFTSSRQINTTQLNILCKYTYELIVIKLPWVNISPSLHKLLAHCVELIETCNDGCGMKEYSEEALEACNKLVRRYRENLSRKCSFELNSRDILMRLLTNSDPVMLAFRKIRKCKKCGDVSHNCRLNCPNRIQEMNDQDLLVNSLFIDV